VTRNSLAHRQKPLASLNDLEQILVMTGAIMRAAIRYDGAAKAVETIATMTRRLRKWKPTSTLLNTFDVVTPPIRAAPGDKQALGVNWTALDTPDLAELTITDERVHCNFGHCLGVTDDVQLFRGSVQGKPAMLKIMNRKLVAREVEIYKRCEGRSVARYMVPLHKTAPQLLLSNQATVVLVYEQLAPLNMENDGLLRHLVHASLALWYLEQEGISPGPIDATMLFFDKKSQRVRLGHFGAWREATPQTALQDLRTLFATCANMIGLGNWRERAVNQGALHPATALLDLVFNGPREEDKQKGTQGAEEMGSEGEIVEEDVKTEEAKGEEARVIPLDLLVDLWTEAPSITRLRFKLWGLLFGRVTLHSSQLTYKPDHITFGTRDWRIVPKCLFPDPHDSSVGTLWFEIVPCGEKSWEDLGNLYKEFEELARGDPSVVAQRTASGRFLELPVTYPQFVTEVKTVKRLEQFATKKVVFLSPSLFYLLSLSLSLSLCFHTASVCSPRLWRERRCLRASFAKLKSLAVKLWNLSGIDCFLMIVGTQRTDRFFCQSSLVFFLILVS